jgi:hypothetical protein
VDVMTRTPALLFAILLGACGGDMLDVGGGTPDKLDATTSDPVPDARAEVASWPVPTQRNARSLQSVGPHLYWMTTDANHSEIRRCEKSDCGNTQATLARILGPIKGFEVRGDVIYGATASSIFSCPINHCTTFTTIVAGISPRAVAFDETNVYWSAWFGDRNLYSCTLDCPGGSGGVALIGAAPVELAVDESRVYWTSQDSTYVGATALMSAPKGNLGAVTTIAAEQNQITALTLHGGYVHWTTSYALGTVARCPITGCADSGPEVLAERQSYPDFVQPDGDSVFWMNGPKAPDRSANGERPVQILRCQLPNCASSIEVLDEGLGGGFAARANATWGGTQGALPAREMVVDEKAIYWFGDIFSAPRVTATGASVDATVRRTERPVR